MLLQGIGHHPGNLVFIEAVHAQNRVRGGLAHAGNPEAGGRQRVANLHHPRRFAVGHVVLQMQLVRQTARGPAVNGVHRLALFQHGRPAMGNHHQHRPAGLDNAPEAMLAINQVASQIERHALVSGLPGAVAHVHGVGFHGGILHLAVPAIMLQPFRRQLGGYVAKGEAHTRKWRVVYVGGRDFHNFTPPPVISDVCMVLDG